MNSGRLWFVILVAVQLGCVMSPGSYRNSARAASPSRPNILFCLADDWSWPHAGVYGDQVVKTPTFDRVAREGALFSHTYCAAPSCTPSRAGILTGQAIHRLEEGASLHGFIPAKFPLYPEILENAGYVVGYQGKGWGPGRYREAGRNRNPAGPAFRSFAEFLKTVPDDKPFCFWFGSKNPHRVYEKGSGLRTGMNPLDVNVPPYLPDRPEVRNDILDYYVEVQLYDQEVATVLDSLESSDHSENTLVVVTSDNGWPFPRAKANVHDAGTRMPMAIRWPGHIRPGTRIEDFVTHCDLAPTFIELAGEQPPAEMTGKSLLALLTGKETPGTRDVVYLERERHANVRIGDLSYPCRAIRTNDYLYIRNFRPERWPAGDPEGYMNPGIFGDIDGSPTKQLIYDNQDDPAFTRFFQLAFEKRPADELYDLRSDPHQIINVAGEEDYAQTKANLSERLTQWLRDTNDPRILHDDDRWDRYPYFGPNNWRERMRGKTRE